MINNRGILSTTDLLNRSVGTSLNSASPGPMPQVDAKFASEGSNQAGSQATSETASLNAKQVEGFDSVNSQPRDPGHQAQQLSASGPNMAQEQVGQEASKLGQNTDPGLIKADVPPGSSDPRSDNSLDTANINSSTPKVSQDGPVSNSDRTGAMQALMDKATTQQPKTPDSTPPETRAEASPSPKVPEAPDVKPTVPDPPMPRQQFHRPPEVEAPNPSVLKTKTPEMSMPNLRNPGAVPSPKMRMPSLRIPKMR